jgi:2-C-methyl-D-erythritol 4-phosphate cytidylyltransferase
VLAIVGVCAYDGVRTGLAASGAKDDAVQIAHDAANTYHSHPDVNATYQAALLEATSHGDTLPVNDFIVTSGGTVTLTVDRKNSTLILGRLHAPLDVMSGTASSTWAP